MKKVIYLFIFFFFLQSSYLFSKTVDNDSLKILFSIGNQPFHFKQTDTSLSNLIFYQPNSSFSNFAFNNGAIGQAFTPLLFHYDRAQENIFRAFSNYFISSDSIRNFLTSKPYTELYYTQGMTKEFLPNVFHTQQIGSQVGISLNYKAISSDGFYNQQESRGQSFSLSLRYNNRRGNYLSNVNFAYNSLKVNENGGLTTSARNDFYAGLSTSNRLELKTNLSTAFNQMKHRFVSLDNYYYFLSKSDSINKPSYKLGIAVNGALSSSSSFFSMTSSADVQNDFFNAIYIDSTVTRDSVWLNKIDLNGGLVLGKWNSKFYEPVARLVYKNEIYNVGAMNSGFLCGQYSKFNGVSSLFVMTKYGLHGRRAGDIKFDFEYGDNFKTGNSFFLKLMYANQKVSYFDNFFISNHHKWSNDFDNIEQASVSGHYFFKFLKIQLEAGYHFVSNYILLNESSTIQQIDKTQSSSYVALYHNASNKWVRSRSYASYQIASESVRIPNLMMRQELAFLINKRSIHAEVGVVGTYVSNYFANSYDPSLRDYAIQNKVKTGGIILIDAFAALRVGSAKIFFKADHCNAGILGYNYELTPFFPLSDFTFKLGIKWSFWN